MNPAQRLAALEPLGPLGQWAQEQIVRLTVENVRLKSDLTAAQARLTAQEQELRQKDQQIDQLQREAHRQAAPFRRPEAQRNPHPGRPGRKPGHPGAYRPKPDHIDAHVRVELACCPRCQGPVSDKVDLTQYFEEIPVIRPHVTEVITQGGWCERCQRQVCATHPLQSGRAGGAAAAQLGPRALGLACDLKAKGLSLRQSVAVLRDHFGLNLTPGGLAQLLQRVGRKLQPQYEQLTVALRQSAVAHADETGWWVGGPGWWLWVFTTPELTLYVVVKSRAAAVARGVIGEDFKGVLVSDCLAIYDDLNPRQHKCYSHHLKAISEACQSHPQAGEGYLRQVQALLRTAIYLKALQPQADPQGFEICRRTLALRAQELLALARPQPQEEKVRMRLWKQRDHLFTFLEHPEVPATNNLAERQLRPAVIARKISCGNKTDQGAAAFQVLASVAATCRQQGRSFIQSVAQRVVLLPPARPP